MSAESDKLTYKKLLHVPVAALALFK